MERQIFDIYGVTGSVIGELVPINFSGIGRIAVPKSFVDASGVSLIPGQEVIAGLADGGIIVDLAPAPRQTELE